MLIEMLGYLGTGILTGLLAGLLGVGGGVIIVPALILVFGHLGFVPAWVTHMAVGTSLASIIGTGWSSTLAHHRRGAVQWDLFRQLVPGIILGAWVGAAIAGFMPQVWLQSLFGGFLIYVGVRMMLPRRECRLLSRPGKWVMATAGGGIGAISAIVGIGGGSLTVPYLVRIGLNLRQAVATSSACGVPIALAGALGFMVSGWGREGLPAMSTGFVYWPAVFGILMTSMPVAPVGARLAHTLPIPVLSRFFGILLLLMGAKLLLG